MPERPRLNLDALEADYDMVAELGDHGDETAYLARRREDGRDVLIRVERTPRGDERNALTLLAADVKALASLHHEHVVPILDGRWIGTDAFAVVGERVAHPTLQEWIERGEQPSNQRVALILQQVNDVLAWAREQKVVHRGVDMGSVYIDPDSDAVDVSFAVRPIPLTGVEGPEGDARSIAGLAVAMLARNAEPADAPIEMLTERRPDIPKRVIERTAALLESSRRSDANPDVRTYIALVAMADPLKEAEENALRGEEELGADRREFETEMERERTALARERQAFEDAMVREKSALAEERAALEREITQERQRLAEVRADLEESLAALAAHRAQLERSIIEERVRLVEERRSLEALRAGTVAPSGAGEEPPAALELPPPPDISIPEPVVEQPVTPVRPTPTLSREMRTVFAGAAALVIIVLAAAFGLAHRRGAAAVTASTSQANVDSSGGAVLVPLTSRGAGASTNAAQSAPPAGQSARPTPADSATRADSIAAAQADSVAAARAAQARRARRQRMLDSIRAVQDTALFALPTHQSTLPGDTSVKRDTSRTDSVVKRDSVRPPKPKADTMPKSKPDTAG